MKQGENSFEISRKGITPVNMIKEDGAFDTLLVVKRGRCRIMNYWVSDFLILRHSNRITNV